MLIRRRHFWVALLIGALAMAGQSRADIYQWEYVNPADPTQGKQQSTVPVPDGVGATAGPNSSSKRSQLDDGISDRRRFVRFQLSR